MLASAEKIQRINNFCRNYKGDDKEVIEWCEEWQTKFLQSMAEGITNGESFFNNDGMRRKFHSSSSER